MTSVSTTKLQNRNQCRFYSPSLRSLFVGCVMLATAFVVFHYVFGTEDVILRNVIAQSHKIIRRVNVQNKTIRHKNNVICVTYLGRLGNNMFQFAAAFAIAKKRNMHFIVPEDNPLVKIFNISALPLSSLGLPQNHCSRISPISDRWHSSYDPAVTNVSNHHDVHLKGYFQSWKYWIDYEKELRQLFIFRQDIMSKAIKQLKHLQFTLKKGIVLVGVHVRRNDYVKETLVGRTVATGEYFVHAFRYFRSKFQDVAFLVVSDDFKWCKATFKGESNLYLMTGNSPLVDMALLSLTNHTISSVGSFSFWGAWLANGTNIFFNSLFTLGSNIVRNYRNNSIYDYVYPGWIPML